MNQRTGVDLIGFGPIGRDLARKIVALESGFYLSSISDSSATIYPKDATEVLAAIAWKEPGKRKLSGMPDVKSGTDPLEGLERSDASVAVDLTNSDYSKREEAKRRALVSLNTGKHYVTANKVALANYFSEILELAKRKNLFVGYGATVCGARHAIRIVQSLEEGEVQSVSAVLNASTTLILSKLEENSDLSLEEACREADREGVLESDWGIDLDGLDAAAKTAILANVIFSRSGISIDQVKRSGVRTEEARTMMGSRGRFEKIRLVSQISKEGSSVAPKVLAMDSPLSVSGRFNIVLLATRNIGEVCVRSLGGGVSLTTSILLSDIKESANRNQAKKNLSSHK